MDNMESPSSSSAGTATMPMDSYATKGPVDHKSHEFTGFDGVDDDVDLDDYHGHLRHQQKDDGFTRLDAREMKRMGKKQELRVSS